MLLSKNARPNSRTHSVWQKIMNITTLTFHHKGTVSVYIWKCALYWGFRTLIRLHKRLNKSLQRKQRTDTQFSLFLMRALFYEDVIKNTTSPDKIWKGNVRNSVTEICIALLNNTFLIVLFHILNMIRLLFNWVK